MVFSSLTFLFIFLPVTLLGYRLLPKKLRIGFLLLASLLFYAWGEPLYVFLMIGSILVNWGIGFKVTGDGPHRKAWLVLSVALNLLLLLIFKYTGLLWDTVKGLFPAPLSEKAVAIRLPIGISFFTFQIMSYVIDVYRGKAKAQKSPVLFGAYVSMFPQLIAGPIVRYVDIEAQLDDPDLSLSGFAQGVGLFVVGLGKKVLLANGVAVLWRELAAMPGETGVLGAWVGLIAYTFQIYFDFSGYSDMAIGLGRMFGFHFLENFTYPFICRTVAEFWSRWHISLGTWFRDYLYIPLGGSRVSKPRLVFNMMVVWTLTGLWHGAAWTYFLWGFGFGVFLVIERMTGLGKWMSGHRLGHFYAMFVVVTITVMIRSDNLHVARIFYGSMFGLGGAKLWDPLTGAFLREYGPFLAAGVLFSLPVPEFLRDRLHISPNVIRAVGSAALLGLTFIAVTYIAVGSYNPFIYFNF